jgi:hypothetical protein
MAMNHISWPSSALPNSAERKPGIDPSRRRQLAHHIEDVLLVTAADPRANDARDHGENTTPPQQRASGDRVRTGLS